MPLASVPVLWPHDVIQPGFIYGWLKPLICVAGVLPSATLSEAKAELQLQCDLQDWSSFSGLCDSFPTVIGHCHWNAALGDLAIAVFDINAVDFHFLYYSKPKLRYLQMYAIDTSVFAVTNRAGKQVPAGPSFHLDFTRPRGRQSSVLDHTVTCQINCGQLFAKAIAHGEGISSRRPVPAWPTGPSASLRSRTSYPSAFLTQAATRLHQLYELYQHFPPPSHTNSPLSPEVVSGYVGFYNCLWLILNDLIIGFALRTFICENSLYLSSVMRSGIEAFLVTDIQRTLLWLNNWPAGLKLNTELSDLCCRSLLRVMIGWNWILSVVVLPRLNNLVHLSGTLGCCGVTMSVAFSSDALALLTLHVRLCYLMSLAVFRCQLRAADSLWKLFRGKRKNILRQRTDSWAFDLDQLLFGTILFTLLAFILPTTAIYYTLFAMMHLSILLVHGTLQTVLILVNDFPLFIVMLKLKDPSRLPGGFFVDLRTCTLQNNTLPMSQIFGRYVAYLLSLRAQYHPLRLIKRIITAEILQ